MKKNASIIELKRLQLHALSRKHAFEHYVRRGEVPHLWREIMNASSTEANFLQCLKHYDEKISLKAIASGNERSSTHYVWRTQRDGRVRAAHAANDGKIFAWDERPATGHPGDEYNCRCTAEPYIQGRTEYAFHSFTSSLDSAADRWENFDFVWHYYFGDGRPVTLEEIGQLREIAERYAYEVEEKGAFSLLSSQLAEAARDNGAGPFVYDFKKTYDFKPVQFSHGGGEVAGLFFGDVDDRGETLVINGVSQFWFSDMFKDPLDGDRIIGREFEVGGTPYGITGEWTASFEAEVFKDKSISRYFHKKKK